MSEENQDYEDFGEIPVDGADDANIPVDIWLQKVTDEHEEFDPAKEQWILTANNYMPRKAKLGGEGSYKAVSTDRKVLVDIVRKHWLPLYQNAVETLMHMKPNSEGVADLYYWNKPE